MLDIVLRQYAGFYGTGANAAYYGALEKSYSENWKGDMDLLLIDSGAQYLEALREQLLAWITSW